MLVLSAELQVYSEFRRITPSGEIHAKDQGGRVREILSPAVPRNGYTSFHVVVKGAPGELFWLYIGQNPEDNARATIYEVQAGDRLRKVDFPVEVRIAEGAAAAVYLVDLFYKREAPVERVKIEPQLFVDSEKRWIVYPMEVRVRQAQIPSIPALVNPEAAGGSAESLAFLALREHLCGAKTGVSPAPGLTIQSLIYRNARQDLALLRTLPKERTSGLLPESGPFCAGEATLPPEWWLTFRRLLYQ